jgi:hypothetical protein
MKTFSINFAIHAIFISYLLKNSIIKIIPIYTNFQLQVPNYFFMHN